MTAADLLNRAKHCENNARSARTYDSKKAWLEDAKEWRRRGADPHSEFVPILESTRIEPRK